jgi:hypothetical protein
MAGRKITSGSHSFPSSGRLWLNLVFGRKKIRPNLGLELGNRDLTA